MIQLSSLLFLVFGFVSATFLRKDVLAPTLEHPGGVLVFYLVVFFGFLFSLGGEEKTNGGRRRFWILLGSSVLIVVMAAWPQTRLRTSDTMRIHDGAVQTEVAADFLLHGTNPYSADFQPTVFGQAPSPYHKQAENLAWTHYAYPPAILISALPSVLVRPWVGQLSDIRWVYIMALVVLATVVIQQQKNWERRSVVAVLLIANPVIWAYPAAGFNDILAVAAMVLSAVCLDRGAWRSSGIMMGVALAAKQTAWLALPLWIWLLWRRQREERARLQFRRGVLAAGITTIIFYGPFLLWNAPAMYDDLVRYVSGTIPYSYPISGHTTLQYLRIFGFIDSPWAVITVWPFQVLAGLAAGWVGWQWIRRRPSGSSWLAASAVVTLGVALMSRFFNDNYLSAIVVLGTAAYLLHHDPESHHQR